LKTSRRLIVWLYDVDDAWAQKVTAGLGDAGLSVVAFSRLADMVENSGAPDVILLGLTSANDEILPTLAALSYRCAVVVSLLGGDACDMRQMFRSGATDVVPRVQSVERLAAAILNASTVACNARARARLWQAVPAL
jgi:FixJ family two-component response regulator